MPGESPLRKQGNHEPLPAHAVCQTQTPRMEQEHHHLPGQHPSAHAGRHTPSRRKTVAAAERIGRGHPLADAGSPDWREKPQGHAPHSPYAVKDYYGVNPEFGTLDDLKHFVQAAHFLGLHVILDWVANHTVWDNNLVSEHPEWYARDWKGDLHPTPWWNWDDIIDLDHVQAAVRQYMTEALKNWVLEVDIDGYRCDVAGFVPTEFWENAHRELDVIKPVFLLAEWENRDLHAAAFIVRFYESQRNVSQLPWLLPSPWCASKRSTCWRRLRNRSRPWAIRWCFLSIRMKLLLCGW